MVSIWQLLILLVLFALTLLPCLMALFSKKVQGSQKLTWFALSLLFGWIGYVPYYFAVVKKQTVAQSV